MKKAILVTGLAIAIAIGAAAQTKKKIPPPPPKPPAPPVEMTNDAPPPAPPPPPPPPPVSLREELENLPQDFQDFLNRNPSVESVYWNKNMIVIVPKDGRKERYVLDEKGIREAEAKYGKLPAAPPPPPPPPAPPVPPIPPKPPKQVQ